MKCNFCAFCCRFFLFSATGLAAVMPAVARQPECRVELISSKGNISYNSNTHADPLNSAIQAAASGDTVRVIGVCRGNFSIFGKDLTLTGRESNQHVDVLDGGGTGRVLSIGCFFFQTTVTISNLVITNGNSSSGGGIGVDTSGTLRLRNSVVTGNKATWGGGLDVSGIAQLENSVVRDNEATNYGGGIHSDWGGQVNLVKSIITSNKASSGGGVAILRGSNMVAVDSSFSYNDATTGTASMKGGGIYSYRSWATLSNSSVADNTAHYGGGIFHQSGVLLLYQQTTIGKNEAVFDGGGVYSINCTPKCEPSHLLGIHSSEVVGNHAGRRGGGIYNAGGWGYTQIVSGAVTSNVASDAGGGIFDETGDISIASGSDVCGNTPDDWPGC